VGIAFLVLAAATVVLFMLWRGLIIARREGAEYVRRVLAYVAAAEDQARRTALTSLEPQIRVASAVAGVRAAARVLIGGPAALPGADDDSAPV